MSLSKNIMITRLSKKNKTGITGRQIGGASELIILNSLTSFDIERLYKIIDIYGLTDEFAASVEKKHVTHKPGELPYWEDTKKKQQLVQMHKQEKNHKPDPEEEEKVKKELLTSINPLLTGKNRLLTMELAKVFVDSEINTVYIYAKAAAAAKADATAKAFNTKAANDAAAAAAAAADAKAADAKAAADAATKNFYSNYQPPPTKDHKFDYEMDYYRKLYYKIKEIDKSIVVDENVDIYINTIIYDYIGLFANENINQFSKIHKVLSAPDPAAPAEYSAAAAVYAAAVKKAAVEKAAALAAAALAPADPALADDPADDPALAAAADEKAANIIKPVINAYKNLYVVSSGQSEGKDDNYYKTKFAIEIMECVIKYCKMMIDLKMENSMILPPIYLLPQAGGGRKMVGGSVRCIGFENTPGGTSPEPDKYKRANVIVALDMYKKKMKSSLEFRIKIESIYESCRYTCDSTKDPPSLTAIAAAVACKLPGANKLNTTLPMLESLEMVGDNRNFIKETFEIQDNSSEVIDILGSLICWDYFHFKNAKKIFETDELNEKKLIDAVFKDKKSVLKEIINESIDEYNENDSDRVEIDLKIQNTETRKNEILRKQEELKVAFNAELDRPVVNHPVVNQKSVELGVIQTELYSLLNRLNKYKIKLMSIENPIEKGLIIDLKSLSRVTETDSTVKPVVLHNTDNIDLGLQLGEVGKYSLLYDIFSAKIAEKIDEIAETDEIKKNLIDAMKTADESYERYEVKKWAENYVSAMNRYFNTAPDNDAKTKITLLPFFGGHIMTEYQWSIWHSIPINFKKYFERTKHMYEQKRMRLRRELNAEIERHKEGWRDNDNTFIWRKMIAKEANNAASENTRLFTAIEDNLKQAHIDIMALKLRVGELPIEISLEHSQEFIEMRMSSDEENKKHYSIMKKNPAQNEKLPKQKTIVGKLSTLFAKHKPVEEMCKIEEKIIYESNPIRICLSLDNKLFPKKLFPCEGRVRPLDSRCNFGHENESWDLTVIQYVLTRSYIDLYNTITDYFSSGYHYKKYSKLIIFKIKEIYKLHANDNVKKIIEFAKADALEPEEAAAAAKKRFYASYKKYKTNLIEMKYTLDSKQTSKIHYQSTDNPSGPPLPPYYEPRFDEKQRLYYIDHFTQSTTWNLRFDKKINTINSDKKCVDIITKWIGRIEKLIKENEDTHKLNLSDKLKRVFADFYYPLGGVMKFKKGSFTKLEGIDKYEAIYLFWVSQQQTSFFRFKIQNQRNRYGDMDYTKYKTLLGIGTTINGTHSQYLLRLITVYNKFGRPDQYSDWVKYADDTTIEIVNENTKYALEELDEFLSESIKLANKEKWLLGVDQQTETVPPLDYFGGETGLSKYLDDKLVETRQKLGKLIGA